MTLIELIAESLWQAIIGPLLLYGSALLSALAAWEAVRLIRKGRLYD